MAVLIKSSDVIEDLRPKFTLLGPLDKCKMHVCGEHSGSVVECLTQDLGAADSSLARVTLLCP